MPMPEPKKDETKQDFVSRCIESLTRDESDKFPSRAQRAAICYSQWGETPEEKEAAKRKKERPQSAKAKSDRH